VDPIPGSIFVYIVPLVVVCSPIVFRKLRTYRILTLSLASSLAIALGIGGYQILTANHLEYYFYKSIYTVFLFCLIFFIACVLEVFDLTVDRWRKLKIPIVTGVLALTMIVAIATNLVFIKVYVHDWFPNAVQPEDLSILFQPDAASYKDILFAGSCNGARNYLEDRWSGARLLAENPIHSEIEISALHDNYTKEGNLLSKYSNDGQKILLIEYSDCAYKILNLTTIKNMPNVTTIVAT